MSPNPNRLIAIVGVGAMLPDAPNAPAFWENIRNKRYSIIETPPERWSIADYYDADHNAPDKTYSKIGSWVRGFEFDWKRFRIPPKVAAAMDEGQQWAVSIAAEALADYGYPDRPLNLENTGCILGTAMGGELHYKTHLRIAFPEYANALKATPEFSQLPREVQTAILNHWHERFASGYLPVTEDSMPGELPNIVAGRVANVLNLNGPNFITDAACASTFAAIDAAVDLLAEGHCDAVITGGVDRNMGVSTFVKFCKIGALSETGSRPFGDGADGFVMGEGSAAFLSSASPMPSATATRSTPSSAVWVVRPTAKARASPRRTRQANSSRHRAPGRTPGWTRRRRRSSRPTAPARASAMSSRSRA